MLQYHVWFEIKPEVGQARGLWVIRQFLQDLVLSRGAIGFRMLQNRGAGERTKLARFHALVEFDDAASMGLAMSVVAARGIHTGLHGEMMRSVSVFHVEVFDDIPSDYFPVASVGEYACEI